MSCVSQEADSFRLKLRTVCCDKAGYNRRGEELLAAERGPDWSSTLCPCDIHALAGCHNKTFDQLFGPHITGLLQWALSLRFSHTLETFRTALTQEIQERLVIAPGQLSPEARQYRQQVLELYVDSRASALPDMVGLLGACNGDWRRRDVVEFLWSCSDSPPPARSTVLGLVVSGVLSVLAASKPSVWPRHRWTGFMRSLSDLSLLDCIHGLLTPAYLRCTRMLGRAESKSPGPGGLATGPGGPQVGLGASSTSTGVAPVELGDPGLHEESLTAVLGYEAPHSLETSVQTPNLAQLNAKDRQAAAAWLSSKPQKHILLMSMAAHPLERLMHQHLHLSSEGWQKEVQTEVAAAVVAGRPAHSTSRIQIAAKCELETSFLQTLDALFHNPKNWQLFEEEALTFRFAGLAFRTLSRMGAAVIQLLVHHHQQYPWRLFLLLDSPQLAPDLVAEPACRKDAWTQRLQRLYPEFQGEEFMAILHLHATQQPVDIASIEAKHASIRRQVCMRSVQTWTLGFSHTSAEWLLQCFRKSRGRAERRGRARRRDQKPGGGAKQVAAMRAPIVGSVLL